jgi:hypothetical protein
MLKEKKLRQKKPTKDIEDILGQIKIQNLIKKEKMMQEEMKLIIWFKLILIINGFLIQMVLVQCRLL